MERRTTLSLQTHYLEKLEGRQSTRQSHSHSTVNPTAVDPMRSLDWSARSSPRRDLAGEEFHEPGQIIGHHRF